MDATSEVPLIAGRGLTLEIGKRLILDHVDLDVRAGEIVTVIGPNGAGKSTLIRILLGLEKPTSGEITRRPGLRIGYVPQRFPLGPNVPLDVKRLLTLTHRASDAEITAALEETGIAHLKDFGGRLIVGWRNAAGIAGARAVAQAGIACPR